MESMSSTSYLRLVMDQILQKKDWTEDAKGKLEKAFLQLEKDYEKIPNSLRSDIANILGLIASLKDDNAALWSQIVELKGTISNHEETISNHEEVIKKLLESVTELNAKLYQMVEMEDTMCLRQAAFAVQEKLLREIGGADLESLWRKHYVTTLNDVSRLHGEPNFRSFDERWDKVRAKFNITENAAEIHRMLKAVKHHGNIVVHDTGFKHISYDKLLSLIGNRVKEPWKIEIWNKLAALNKKLSEAREEDLFSYNDRSSF